MATAQTELLRPDAILPEILQLQADVRQAVKDYQAALRAIDWTESTAERQAVAPKAAFDEIVGVGGEVSIRIRALMGPLADFSASGKSNRTDAAKSRHLHLSAQLDREAKRLENDVRAAQQLLSRSAASFAPRSATAKVY